MASEFIKRLKRKYTVTVSHQVYCTSMGHYFAKALIKDGKTREWRDIDLNGCRIMWRDKPFTYQGYPAYVQQSIADQLKQMLDEGELSVYEHDRDGNRRYYDLRYHVPEHLKREIDRNFIEYGSGVQS